MRKLVINGQSIDDTTDCYTIAEIGHNHQGKLKTCMEMFKVARDCGAVAQMPGDLVELDTLDIRPVPDVVLKQFTARDCISRWDVFQVHSRATAKTATMFLDSLVDRMPCCHSSDSN